MFKPEIPFKDEDIDKLLENPTSPLSLILTTKPFRSPNFPFNNLIPDLSGREIFNDYYRLIRTMTSSYFKKLILCNPGLATNAFASICETARSRTYEYNDFQLERIQLIDWIIDEKLVNHNHMLLQLMNHRHIPQMNRIFNDQSITKEVLFSCLTDLCCWMLPSGSGWPPEVIAKEKELFDKIFNDPRVDVAYNNNNALSLAVLHKNYYAMNKLLVDPRVLACNDWSNVVENVFRIGDQIVCRLILDYPHAEITRRAFYEFKDKPEFAWIYDHPKYNSNIFTMKTPEELILLAFEKGYVCDDAKRILNIALRRLRGEKEDEDSETYWKDEEDVYAN